jgi:hypothetical protein
MGESGNKEALDVYRFQIGHPSSNLLLSEKAKELTAKPDVVVTFVWPC